MDAASSQPETSPISTPADVSDIEASLEDSINQVSTSQIASKARKASSWVWEHFKKPVNFPSTMRATCNHCDATYSFKNGATSTAKAHVMNRHPDKLSNKPGVQGSGKSFDLSNPSVEYSFSAL